MAPEYNHKRDWFYEGQVSNKLVTYLITNGYTILKDNSQNIKSRGEDIVAISPTGIKEIIEVKGYPTIFHTKGPKKGDRKPTNPKLQAKHWFSEAILSSVFNYHKHQGSGNFILALAFPLHNSYKELITKVEGFYTANNIDFKIYFIDEAGFITIDNLCIHNRV